MDPHRTRVARRADPYTIHPSSVQRGGIFEHQPAAGGGPDRRMVAAHLVVPGKVDISSWRASHGEFVPTSRIGVEDRDRVASGTIFEKRLGNTWWQGRSAGQADQRVACVSPAAGVHTLWHCAGMVAFGIFVRTQYNSWPGPAAFRSAVL